MRKKIFTVLERSERADKLGKAVDLFLIVLIAVNVVSVVFETVDWMQERYAFYFATIEFLSVAVFSVEYALRVWSCVEHEELQGERFPRLKYAMSPLALIDLIAILPFYLSFLFVADLRVLRVMRLLRVFKLTRYSSAMTMLLNVFREEANAFFAGFFILIVLLILAASGAYLVEHDAQPVKFGSIPSAMWWAMATLTTVGYGDVTPITAWGKFFGAFVAVVGIGMAALPAGILASGLADQLRRNREQLSEKLRKALQDGVIDENEETELEAFRKELGLSHRLALDVRRDVQRSREAAPIRHCPGCGWKLEEEGEADN